MSIIQYCDEEEEKEETVNNYKDLFNEYKIKLPTLEEALNQMFTLSGVHKNKTDELIKDILDKCKEKIEKNFSKIKEKYDKIDKNDAYIICSYTCEASDPKYSPYKILNINLVSNDRKKGIKIISKYLYILLKSLRKLTIVIPKNYIYRCLRNKVSLEKDPDNDKWIPYQVGNQKTFWGFTSTSPNIKTVFNFLDDNGSKNIKCGSIFHIEGEVWGYDITLFNIYNEKEILLEPERKYIIKDAYLLNDVVHVICNVSKSPIILDTNNSYIDSINKYIAEEKGKDNNDITHIKNSIIKIEMEIAINEINDDYRYICGIGFLCNIPSKNMKALITFSNIIDRYFLIKAKSLKFFIKNEEKEINMKVPRYKKVFEDLNITIIEIVNEDNINNFLQIDNFIKSKDYSDENIIFIEFDKNNNHKYIKDKIIKNNNNYILSSTKNYEEGLILLNNNLKIIGIIKNRVISMNLLLKKINYIKAKFEIKHENLGKEIQILNDTYISHRNDEIRKINNIIINRELTNTIYRYLFNKEGIYIIYYLSDELLTDMSYMFFKCSSLKEIDLSQFNTYVVTNMSYMFSDCLNLKKINLRLNNIKNIECNNIFEGCSSLNESNLPFFSENMNFNNNNFDNHLIGLLKLCLLKEISLKLNNLNLELLPREIKNIMCILRNTCIEFIDIGNNEENKIKIRESLSRNNEENLTNFYNYVDKVINTNHINLIINLLSQHEIERINDIKARLNEYINEIKIFNRDFEKSLKDSIFEFSLVSIVVKEREDFNNFQQERNRCTNKIEKILYHGCPIQPISYILNEHFKRASFCIHGKGIYFSDNLDYCWFYGNKGEGHKIYFNTIPEINESFTIIGCSIYYDEQGFKHVYDDKYTPKKNEINLAYVNDEGESTTFEKNKFCGTEYVIWEYDQICPFLGMKLKRNEFCIIWRDNNFSNKSLDINKFFLEEKLAYIRKISKYNIYPACTSEEALKLIERKKYNKIILISNIEGNIQDTKQFIFDARKIIRNDIIILFLNNNDKNLEWIQKLYNVLFTNENSFFEKYIQCFEGNNIKEKILNLKSEMEKFYKVKFNFKNRFLEFPNFKKSGKYSEISFD